MCLLYKLNVEFSWMETSVSYSHVPCETKYLDVDEANFVNALILSHDYAVGAI